MKTLFMVAAMTMALQPLLFSQEAPAPQRNDYHQIFLDSPVQKVNKVNYNDDSGPVDFKLSPDGKAIHLLDYKGQGGVKAEIVYPDGTVEEVVRSKCGIHSLQVL